MRLNLEPGDTHANLPRTQTHLAATASLLRSRHQVRRDTQNKPTASGLLPSNLFSPIKLQNQHSHTHQSHGFTLRNSASFQPLLLRVLPLLLGVHRGCVFVFWGHGMPLVWSAPPSKITQLYLIETPSFFFFFARGGNEIPSHCRQGRRFCLGGCECRVCEGAR